MAVAYSHMGKRERIISFGKQRISEIKEAVDDMEAEKEMWENIINMQDPCQECGGFGKLTHHITESETETVVCGVCGGSGKKQS